MYDKTVQNPFVIFTCAFILGIIIGKYYISYPLSLYLTFICYLICIIFLFLKAKSGTTSVLLTICLIFSGVLRYDLATEIMAINHLSTMNPDTLQALTGNILQAIYRHDDRDKYILNSISADYGDTTIFVSGKVLITTNKIGKRFKYGDRVKIKGQVRAVPKQRNPGQFDYRYYLALRDINFLIHLQEGATITHLNSIQGSLFKQKIVIPLKRHCKDAFLINLNDETSALLHALLLGEKQDLDSNMIRNFQEVGVVHVLAISGLHIGFIIAIVFILFSILRFSHRFKIYGLIAILSIYVVLVQFRPSVLRASLMAVLFLIGKLSERRISVYNIVFGSGFIILILDPRELFNPGFQFSFIAVLSIIYGYEKLNYYLPVMRALKTKYAISKTANYFLKMIWIPFLVSTAAVLGTMPLTVYYYGMIPALAVFSNLIVIPLVGVIVLLGIFLLVISLFSSFLAHGIGTILNILQHVLQVIVKTISELPVVSIQTVKPAPLLIALIMVLLFLCINFRESWARRIFVIVVSCCALSVPILHLNKNSNLEITFLDVGQGDAAFLLFPNGNTMLIDAGDSHQYWDNGENTILPFLKYKGILQLNYLIGSHAHNDHIGGFNTLIRKVEIDTVVLSPYRYNSYKYADLVKLCESKGIPIKYVHRGDLLFPDSSCRVYILHPTHAFSQANTYDGGECNNSSLVLKIQYGDSGILFSGDLERLGERPVLNYASFLESEILKVSHHGSNTSSSYELLDCVKPIISVISVAHKNTFNHPSPRTLARLSHYCTRCYLTSTTGALVFEVSETEIKKVNWRNE